MSDKQCPLCGAPIRDDSSVCEQCSDNAQKRDSIDLFFEDETIDEESVPVEELVSDVVEDSSLDVSKEIEDASDVVEDIVLEKDVRPARTIKREWIIVLVVALIVAIIIGFCYVRYQQEEKQKLEKELALWYSCIEKNTPSAYSDYITQYPKGQFYSDAQVKITELRKSELKDWDKLLISSDLLDYSSFLNKYPETSFRGEARRKMDSLCWIIAEKENTADSYKVYINNYDQKVIEGYYITLAQGRYDYLSKIKTVEGEELEKVKSVIETYFTALSKQDSRLKDLFPVVVDNYFGEKNRSALLIIKAMKDYMKQNSIKSLTYIPNVQSVSVLKDSAGIYFMDIPVEKKLVYNAKKKPPLVVAETLKVELNPKLQVRSLHTTDK